MVEGMGGDKSEHYLKFKEHCCEAYNILRKSSNLILNLFQLMLDADIPDISEEADKAILKVQEKFRLELSDEEAGKLFQSLINESVSALAPQINEVVHRWAQVCIILIQFVLIFCLTFIFFFLFSIGELKNCFSSIKCFLFFRNFPSFCSNHLLANQHLVLFL